MLYIYTISEHVIHRVYTESIDIHSPCLIDVINTELTRATRFSESTIEVAFKN